MGKVSSSKKEETRLSRKLSAGRRTRRVLKEVPAKKERVIESTASEKKKDIRVSFTKSEHNPLLSPVSEHRWESMQTFNPAVIQIDGTVYFFYRALGDNDFSRVGLAISHDGETIAERLPYPIYTYYPHEKRASHRARRTSHAFASGGGAHGGCEDPRVTIIEDRIYMIFVAFNGWHDIRLAMTSISIEDFLAKRFVWTPLQFLSDPNVIDKSGVVFPEKVGGKYVFLHRVFPNILVDFEDSLDFSDGRVLQNKYAIHIREDIWDSRKIGAGAPPIKTDEGWLLVYYATDDRDASQYKIGIMLLDLENPLKVLYRTDAPAISPTEWYENIGHKAGIVYPCGAAIKNNKLYVYYGGADTFVNVAYQDLDTLFYQLKHQNVVE